MQRIRRSWGTTLCSAVLLFAGANLGVADVPSHILALPEGYVQGAALTANANDQIIGVVMSLETGARSCLWTNGLPTVLPMLPGYANSQPSDINSAGVVVGYCETSEYVGHAVRWLPGAELPEDLGVLSGALGSNALAVNEQGQILCSNEGRYSLWEEGVGHTEICMPNGGRIDASGVGVLASGALLLPNGLVAGTAEIGHWDGSIWVPEYNQAVLWDKNGLAPTITPLSTGAGRVEAASPNGKIVGYSEADGYFIYDANTSVMTSIEMPSTDLILYEPDVACGVNDSGQVVFSLSVYDSADPQTVIATELWVWDAGTWTPISFEGLLGTSFPYGLVVYINGAGQVAGTLVDFGGIYVPFAWSAEKGTQRLLAPSGYDGIAITIGESGLVYGGGQSSDLGILPIYWDPDATLTFSVASVSKSSKGVTVILEFGNATADVIRDLTLSNVELDGVASKASLPIKVGSIKPGTTKELKLVFRSVQAGAYDLNLEGTSTLGDFSASLLVIVP